MAKIKKAQTGAGVSKGMVRGERSEGKLYKKADADKWGKGMADALDRQAGLGKYAPKKNDAINNKPKSKGQFGSMLGGLVGGGIEAANKPGGLKGNWRSLAGGLLGGPIGGMLGAKSDKKAGLRRAAKADSVIMPGQDVRQFKRGGKVSKTKSSSKGCMSCGGKMKKK